MFKSTFRWTLLAAVALAANVHAATPAPCDVPKDINTPTWTARCDKAIDHERDLKKRAVLLFGRAYAAVEQYRYDDALVALDAAVAADPDCIRCRHERAYLNGELGYYTKAIEDLDHEIDLAPTAAAFQERAYARMFSGDLPGAYRDRAREVDLNPESIDALLARAAAASWVGNFDASRADAEQALAMAKEHGDEKQQAAANDRLKDLELWQTASPGENPASRCVMKSMSHGEPTTLIGDCTRAFFEAPDKAAMAEALTTRATAWTVLATDPDNATVDERVAVGLDPKNYGRYVNLGFSFLQNHHSWAANREFERALAIERNWLALAGRAQARMNLNDPKGAKADAEESMAMHPSEAGAWVLADLALAAGERDHARELFLAVYGMGSRDDGLLAQLKELGVDDPDKAVAEAKAKKP